MKCWGGVFDNHWTHGISGRQAISQSISILEFPSVDRAAAGLQQGFHGHGGSPRAAAGGFISWKISLEFG